MADRDANLAERLLEGDKRALARGISLVEDDDPRGWALVREVYPHTGSAPVVGFTGPPGAGKSTLIGALVAHRRKADRQVAVLSIDPSSPFRGGALLGDRIRLTEHFLDPGVFIRSMATRGALGGLAEAALQAALLMDAAGRDDVFLETVGVGQAEVDVIDHADSVVLVLIPGSGDSIQALKAGVMEIPDIIVVNKADHPLTDTMVREIKGVLTLAPQGSWPVPIVKTEAHRGEGVEELDGQARRAPRARRGRGHAVRAPPAQPDERGARPRDRAPAARAGGDPARGPRGPRAARRGRRAPAGPRERGQRDPRPRRRRGRRRRQARPAGGGDRVASMPASGSCSGGLALTLALSPRSASSASCARRAPGCAPTRSWASARRCSRSRARYGFRASRHDRGPSRPSRVAAQSRRASASSAAG